MKVEIQYSPGGIPQEVPRDLKYASKGLSDVQEVSWTFMVVSGGGQEISWAFQGSHRGF